MDINIGKLELNTRTLWIINACVGGLALIVLIVGLVSYPRSGTEEPSSSGAKRRSSEGNASGREQASEDDSLLVASVRRYTYDRLTPKPKPNSAPASPPSPPRPPSVPDFKPTPPKPPEPTPPPTPEPTVEPEPHPVPKVKPPPPRSTVSSTMVFDESFGLAWIQEPGEPEMRQVSAGTTVEEHYMVVSVDDGIVTLERDGFRYELAVPQPEKEDASAENNQPTPPPNAAPQRDNNRPKRLPRRVRRPRRR